MNSSTGNLTAGDNATGDESLGPGAQGTFIFFYAVIFLLGTFGNCLVVFVVCRNKAMHTVTNVFITNLAFSDIMICLLCVPFTPLSAFMRSWIFGAELCRIVAMSTGVSVYVSTLTSLAIAVDRYFVIVHPFKPRMKLSTCLLLIVLIWIISISISLPLGIYQELQFADASELKIQCQENWPFVSGKRFFTICSLMLQYVIPFAAITYSYAKVSLALRRRSRPGQYRDREQIEIKRKARTNRMLIAMVVIFAICWLPLNIVHISSEINSDISNSNFYIIAFLIAHVVAMSSTVYNPFLYAWLNENFRKEFKLVLPCFFKMSAASNYHDRQSEYLMNETTVHTQTLSAPRSAENAPAEDGEAAQAQCSADPQDADVKVTRVPLRVDDD